MNDSEKTYKCVAVTKLCHRCSNTKSREIKAQGHWLAVITSSCCQYYMHKWMASLKINRHWLLLLWLNAMLCDRRNKCQWNDKHALNIEIVNRQVEGHIMRCKINMVNRTNTKRLLFIWNEQMPTNVLSINMEFEIRKFPFKYGNRMNFKKRNMFFGIIILNSTDLLILKHTVKLITHPYKIYIYTAAKTVISIIKLGFMQNGMECNTKLNVNWMKTFGIHCSRFVVGRKWF